MDNKLLSYKASKFHQQNVPAKWGLQWGEFICCIHSGSPEYENVQTSGAVRHFWRVLDYIFVLGDDGIKYLDIKDDQIKPTNIVTGSWTWAKAEYGSRIVFGGAPNAGLMYSTPADPYTIKQTNITAGTVYSGDFSGINGFNRSSPAIHLLTSNGAYYETFDSETFYQTSGWTDIDFKYGVRSSGIFFGGTNGGIYNLKNPTSVASGNFYASFLDSYTNTNPVAFIFGGIGGSDGIFRLNGTSLATVSSSIHGYCAARANDNSIYICTDEGIKQWTGSALADTNITTGTFFYAALGEDGFLYFCGEDGIYFLDYDRQIKFTGKSGEYVESILAPYPRNKMYFTDADGALIREIKDNRGNTGYATALKLKIVKTKFSKELQSVAEYSVLNDVSPQISNDVLKRMSKSEIDQRIAGLWDTVAKPANLNLNTKYYNDEPVICEIGNFGFHSAVIGAGVGPGRKTYHFTPQLQLNEWYEDLSINYIDNIRWWNKNKVQVLGVATNTPQILIALIDFPPEEWDMNSSTSRDLAIQKAQQSPHRMLVSPNPPIDVSTLYENENAKTIVVFAPSNHVNGGLTNVWLAINGEILSLSMLTFFNLTWSDRVSGSIGKMIAKTLTMTQAVLDKVTVFSILDAFDTYPAITESDYKAMSDGAINERATALINCATQGNKYRKNNEVIQS